MREVSSVAVAIGLLCSGCLSATVFDYRGDRRAPPSRRPLEAHLALNDLAYPTTRVEVVNEARVGHMDTGDPRLTALEDRLFALYAESGMARSITLAERLDRAGLPEPGYVVQYRVRSHQASQSTDPQGAVGSTIAMILFPLLAPAWVCAPTRRTDHTLSAEVVVYRSETARIVAERSATTNERISQYDTSVAREVFRARYDVRAQSGHGVCNEPSGVDRRRWNEREGRQLATKLFEASAVAVHHAIHRDLAQRPAVPQPPAEPPPEPTAPTLGPEPPTAAETELRGRLDAATDAILLCVNADAAALIVRWDGSTASVEVRDDPDPVVNGCIRAAIGELRLPEPTLPGSVLHVVHR